MASYKQAIKWIIDNDDVDFLYEESGIISVTASLVADLFKKTDEQVIKDLLKADDSSGIRKQYISRRDFKDLMIK